VGGNTAALRPSLSREDLAQLPSLKIRDRVRNPVVGCHPDEVVETRNWMTHSQSIHGPMPAVKPRAAGSASKFGIRGDTGKIEYGVQFGVPEALGVSRPSTANLQPSESAKHFLRKSPSMAELDELLARRCRARGRGGSCTQVVNIIQPKWNVMNGAGSSSSVMRPHQLPGA
jgi:hypothetical protein